MTRPTRMRIIALAALLALPAERWAEAQVRKTTMAPKSAATSTVNIDFKGGTLADYVILLRSLNPSANIILEDAAAEMPLPPIALRNVSIASALKAVEATGGAVARSLRIQTIAADRLDAGTEAHVLRLQNEPIGNELPLQRLLTPMKSVRAFSLAPLSLSSDATGKHLEANAIAAAVESALALVSTDAAQAVVKLDNSTHLLLVSGSAEQIETAAQVIGELLRTKNATPTSEESMLAQLRRLQEVVDQMSIELAALRKRVDAIRK